MKGLSAKKKEERREREKMKGRESKKKKPVEDDSLCALLPYLSTSTSKGGVPRSCQGTRVPQLSAHYIGILYCPVVLTDSSPRAVIEDLHSPLHRPISTHKTNQWVRYCS